MLLTIDSSVSVILVYRKLHPLDTITCPRRLGAYQDDEGEGRVDLLDEENRIEMGTEVSDGFWSTVGVSARSGDSLEGDKTVMTAISWVFFLFSFGRGSLVLFFITFVHSYFSF